MLTTQQIDKLLTNSDDLFANIYSFSFSPNALPGKSHIGISISHQDQLELRDSFVRELKNTMCNWVYSKSRYNDLFNREFEKRNKDAANASSQIQQLARDKFRKGHPQGQFGELLLFNLLQHQFSAPPLLRKMPLTTNPAIERHGSDAIHYRPSNNVHQLYLGEAKSYKSNYSFKKAIDDAISSILTAYENFHTELGLYTYDNFIEEPLREIAEGIKENKLAPITFDLVCIVSYNETKKKDGYSQAEIEQKIKDCLSKRLDKYTLPSIDSKKSTYLNKLHFIIMPIWDFETILDGFQTA